jgi:hypothetical protein
MHGADKSNCKYVFVCDKASQSGLEPAPGKAPEKGTQMSREAY